MRRLAFMTVGFGAACFFLCKGLLAGIFLLIPVLILGIWRQGTRKRCAILLLGLLLGTLWSSFYMLWKVAPARALDGSTYRLTVQLTHGSQDSTLGRIADGVTEIDGKTYNIRVHSQQPNHRAGDLLSFQGKIRFCGDKKPFLAARGIFLEVTVPGVLYTSVGGSGFWTHTDNLRMSMEQRFQDHLPAQTVDFAKALFLGEHLEDAWINDLSVTGLSHMVAVSGMHLVLLMAVFGIFSFHQALPSFLLGVPGMLAFGAVCGFPASICRASVMMFLFLLSRVLRRDYDQQTALAASVLTLLLVRPTMALSVGLQLSTSAVLGLLCFQTKLAQAMTPASLRVERDGPKSSDLGKRLWNRVRVFAIQTVAATLAASALSVPLAVYYFGVVSLIAPLANILALPMVPFGFWGSFCTWIFGSIWAPLGDFFGTLTALPLNYLRGLCGTLAKLPFAAVYPKASSMMAVFLAGAVVQTLLAWGFHCVRRKTLALLLCLGLVGTLGAEACLSSMETLEVTALNAGRGSCVILRSRGEIYVVDCGGDHEKSPGEMAARILQSQGCFHIDGLILTDTGKEQISGVPQLLHRMDVERIYTAKTLPEFPEIPQTLVEETLEIPLKTGKITVFAHPDPGKSQGEGLSVLFTAGNYDTLIGGNWSTEAWISILPELPDVEICVLPPSREFSPGIFRKLAPERLILSGEGGFPLRDLAERMGCTVQETAEQSRIVIRG